MTTHDSHESAESTVRRFMAAWPQWRVDELTGFFAGEAVWVDGHNEPCDGVDAIAARLAAIGRLLPGPVVEVKNLLASGGTVMVERIDVIQFQGTTFNVEVTGVFDLDGNARIVRWHDYYDSRALEEQIVALLSAPK